MLKPGLKSFVIPPYKIVYISDIATVKWKKNISPLKARKSDKNRYCDSWKSNNYVAIKERSKELIQKAQVYTSPLRLHKRTLQLTPPQHIVSMNMGQ